MYVFSLISRWMYSKGKIADSRKFAKWYSLYLIFILNSAFYLYLFVSNGGEGAPFPLKKMLIGAAIICVYSFCRFFKVAKTTKEQQEPLKASALDWCNTVYFAGFAASIIMFLFVQDLKFPLRPCGILF